MLYLSRDTSLSAIFFIHTSTGSALGGILYFEELLLEPILQLSDGFFIL